ncbi:MAG: hypothetical protein ACK5LP_03940 [Campylobacteraceae bacterium]
MACEEHLKKGSEPSAIYRKGIAREEHSNHLSYLHVKLLKLTSS